MEAALDNSSVLMEPKILFVDDERRVLTSMRAMFRRKYNVFVANSGKEALEILDREPIDVVVSDQRMPEMTGVQVLSAVKERFPRAMRVLLTGYADLQAIEDSINHSEVFRYLMKPCEPKLLKETIELAIVAARDGAAPTTVAAAVSEAVADDAADSNTKPVDATATGFVLEAVPEAPRTPNVNATSGVAARAHAPVCNVTDVLVLSRDRELINAIGKSAGETGRVHVAGDTDQALEVLSNHPIGVLVTDEAVDENAVSGLTTTLKQHVPELVTIVASERSDAHALIDLINHGQVFRFLLKPVQVGQCRIWLNSASRKYEELVENVAAPARHRVAAAVENDVPGFLAGVVARMAKIKARFRRVQA